MLKTETSSETSSGTSLETSLETSSETSLRYSQMSRNDDSRAKTIHRPTPTAHCAAGLFVLKLICLRVCVRTKGKVPQHFLISPFQKGAVVDPKV